MRPGDDTTYNFVFRALLTEEALDRAGRSAPHSDTDETKIAQLLSLNTLDDKLVQKARAMSIVYTAIAAFENSVRELIAKTLLDHVGADWWNQKVSDKIRTVAKTTDGGRGEDSLARAAGRRSDRLHNAPEPDKHNTPEPNPFRALHPQY